MKKISLSIFGLICVSQLNAAIEPNYNLHCEFAGKIVERADETFPPKVQPGDKVVHVNLPLKTIGSWGFYTTGADYFARFKRGSNTLSVYLHSAGYSFPMEKTVGVSVQQENNQRVRLFYTNVSDYGNTVVEGSVLRALGIHGVDEYETALRIACNDYGSERPRN